MAGRPGRVWARLHGLATDTMPADGPLDLFGLDVATTTGDPVAPDGHLRPEWVGGGWSVSPSGWPAGPSWPWTSPGSSRRRWPRWTAGRWRCATARAESAAELLCAELAADGLPVDRAVAEEVIAAFVGPRPRSEADAAAQRAARDAEVLRHAPAGVTTDLRSPAQVKSLLARIGVEVPDTRAWRLRELRDAHPLVEALLDWRKAERIATTYGYGWLDEHLGADGRLRGAWTGSDGAAGRMTASAGLHNMPAELRPAVSPPSGHVFVRADLGQIEPRVLAAVSGDRALVAAARADDLYAPVAAQLGVDRATAKVAVLGAMYGQTTGHGAQALRGLTRPTRWPWATSSRRPGRAGRPRPAHLRRPADPAGGHRSRGACSRAAAAAATPATRWSRARRPSCSRCGR